MRHTYITPSVESITWQSQRIVCASGDKEFTVNTNPINNGWGNSPVRRPIIH